MKQTYARAAHAAKTPYATEAYDDTKAADRPRLQVGAFISKITVVQNDPIYGDDMGGSYGEALDAHLKVLAAQRAMVSSVTIEFNEELWGEYAESLRAKGAN